VVVSDQRADELKNSWRNVHPKIKRYWYQCEDAAITAVMNPGSKFCAGAKGREVTYIVRGSFLWCRLPSGRVLCYPYPQLTPGKFGSDQVSYMYVDAMTKKWIRGTTYGGSFVENITQAVARDVLAEALVRLEALGYQTVMHVHDEVVVEVPEADRPQHGVEHVEHTISELPTWATDLPVAAEGWRGKRYRK